MELTKDSLSPFVIGTMRLGKWGQQMTTKQLEAFVKDSVELGLIDFDHADIYGDYTTEAEFGMLFKEQPALRQQIRLISKCGIKMVAAERPEHAIKSYDLSAAHIKASVENSLTALRTDYLDMLLLHRADLLMDPAEIAEAFDLLKREGKVLKFGVSNFSVSQFDLLHSYTPLIANQVEISLQNRIAFENGVLDQCLKGGIIPMAWSPVGGGALFQEGVSGAIKALQVAARALSIKYDAGIDQILMAWLRKHPAGIVPVLGTSKIERIKAAQASLQITITREEWYALWQAATGEEIA